MSLNRELTKTEKMLVLVLTIALLCLSYYKFIYQPVQQRIAAADTTELDAALLTEQAKSQKITEMKADIESNKGKETGIVGSYDNFTQEANELNAIFAQADTFNFSFSQPVADGDAVRRNIGISFVASDYQVARRIIQQVHDCQNRCLIKDVNVSAQGGNGQNGTANVMNSAISVTMNVTFFETLYDAHTTAGLDFAKSESNKNRSTGLAGADVSNLERSDIETLAESVAAN